MAAPHIWQQRLTCRCRFRRAARREEVPQDKPHAVETINNSSIIDDYIDSVETVADTIQLLSDLCEISSSGGFQLEKLASSHQEVLKHFPQDQWSKAMRIPDDDVMEFASEDDRSWDPQTKTLGVAWKVTSDVLTSVANPQESTAWNKLRCSGWLTSSSTLSGLWSPTSL